MPFQSEAQRRLFWAKMPRLAEQWQQETPKGAKLPERKVGHSPKTPPARPRKPAK